MELVWQTRLVMWRKCEEGKGSRVCNSQEVSVGMGLPEVFIRGLASEPGAENTSGPCIGAIALEQTWFSCVGFPAL